MTNNISDKITKLLRLSERATGPEAELALTNAQRLATQHQIDLTKLDTTEGEKFIPEPFTSERRVTVEKRILRNIVCWILQRHFKVQAVYHGNEMTLIGRHSDVVLANYLYGWLTDHFIREWNNRGPSLDGKRRAASSFWYGMFQAIDRKLTLEKQGLESTLTGEHKGRYELAILDDKQQLAAELFRRFGHIRRTSSRIGGRESTRREGYARGEKTNLPGLPLNNSTASALQ